MITLELHPDVLEMSSIPALEMKTESQNGASESAIIQTTEGHVLGRAQQGPNPHQTVRFYQGKGGFSAVVCSNDLIYFALPGSTITLPDTQIELPGDFIKGQPLLDRAIVNPAPQQMHAKQAMILGAGTASRFEPISGDTTGYSKPSVPLVGEDSVITAIAKLLQQHGFSKILINTYYKPDSLKAQLADLTDIEIIYIDESSPSGTAGGLVKALQHNLVDTTQPILIIQGDAITDADLSFLMNTHQERHAAVTIGGQIVPDRDVDKFGIIETDAIGDDGQSGHITSFKEKPSLTEAGPCRFANSGFYILAPEIYPLFLAVAEQPHQKANLYDYAQDFFPEVLKAINAEQIKQHQTQIPMTFWAQALGGYWGDMGNPTQYIEAVRDIYEGHVKIDMPQDMKQYYDEYIIYWPGTKQLAKAEQAQLSGNVIVAKHF